MFLTLKRKMSLEMCSQTHSRNRGFTRSLETQVSFCSSIMVCGFIFLSWSQDVFSASVSWLPSAWRQNPKNKIWTDDTSFLSPLGSFPSTSAYISLSLLGGSRDSLATGSLGRWALSGSRCLPKEMSPLLGREKSRFNIEKQWTESVKTTNVHGGPKMC